MPICNCIVAGPVLGQERPILLLQIPLHAIKTLELVDQLPWSHVMHGLSWVISSAPHHEINFAAQLLWLRQRSLKSAYGTMSMEVPRGCCLDFF